MARTNYQRGVEAERRCQDDLEKVGYKTIRTAGSHGSFDVIAWCPIGTRFIQIKRSKDDDWMRTLREVSLALAEMPHPPHSTFECWVWQDNKGWVSQVVT